MRLDSENFIRLQRVHFIVFLLWPFSGLEKKSEIENGYENVYDAFAMYICFPSLLHFLFQHCLHMMQIFKVEFGENISISLTTIVYSHLRKVGKQTVNPIEKKKFI